MQEPLQLWSLESVAHELNCTFMTVWNLCKRSELKSVMLKPNGNGHAQRYVLTISPVHTRPKSRKTIRARKTTKGTKMTKSNLTSQQITEALDERKRTGENIFQILERMESTGMTSTDLQEAEFDIITTKGADGVEHYKIVPKPKAAQRNTVFERRPKQTIFRSTGGIIQHT